MDCQQWALYLLETCVRRTASTLANRAAAFCLTETRRNVMMPKLTDPNNATTHLAAERCAPRSSPDPANRPC